MQRLEAYTWPGNIRELTTVLERAILVAREPVIEIDDEARPVIPALAQAMPAVISGEVASSFATIVSALPQVASGKLRGLAVTSAKRFPSAPEFPTVAESGLPGYEAVAWYGVFAPAGTPPTIVGQLNANIVKIVNSPEVRELLIKQGAESYATSPEEFSRVVAHDVEKWAQVVKISGAKAN